MGMLEDECLLAVLPLLCVRDAPLCGAAERGEDTRKWRGLICALFYVVAVNHAQPAGCAMRQACRAAAAHGLIPWDDTCCDRAGRRIELCAASCRKFHNGSTAAY